MSGRVIKDKETEIQEYEFQSFSRKVTGPAKDYKLPELFSPKNAKTEKFEREIFQERAVAHEKQFRINPMVMEHRGIKRQIENEREAEILEEVERRVTAIKEQAFEQGFNEGVEAGKKEVYEQTLAATEEKLANLTGMIESVLNTQENLVTRQHNKIYELINNLTKWIILRELKKDGQYLERLLEKLVLEMQARKNLLIQVNAKEFEQMPEVLEIVQKKLGQLPNTRIEVDHQSTGSGMILECENGIINGTIEEQFKSLDKLFEQVMVTEGF